jgi:hypothetical protein
LSHKSYNCVNFNLRMQVRRLYRRIAWFGFAVCLPVCVQFSLISTPAAVYAGGTASIAIANPEGAAVTALTAGGQTITFSSSMTALTVGGVGGWGFWGSPPDTESATPRVLATPANETSLTIALSAPVNTFGFEIEPANSGGFPPTPFLFNATFLNGTNTLGAVSRSVTFNGAMLIAATSTTPITSVRITAPATAGGWAIAQFRSGNVPTALASVPALSPAALVALALLLASAGTILARRALPLN